MRNLFTYPLKSLAEIAFPQVCICCSNSLNSPDRFLCDSCRYRRFELYYRDESSILPDHVKFCYQMWSFDKGGYLQLMLHKLKYDYLKGVGVELGQILGRQFLYYNSDVYTFKPADRPLIVPVPLHPSKQRKRGYNQARALGVGLSQSTGWELIEEGIVVRQKRTTTQTGLDTDKRTENLRNAFKITDSGKIEGRLLVIVDDVFTTGATTFELIKILVNSVPANSDTKAGILTVAGA